MNTGENIFEVCLPVKFYLILWTIGLLQALLAFITVQKQKKTDNANIQNN
jgi:hypothetical protein